MGTKILKSNTNDSMNSVTLKETRVTHRTGALKLKKYYVGGVYCHWHDEFEFLIAGEGELECIVDAVKYRIRRGEAIIIHPHELHSVVNNSPKFYAIVFDASVVCGEELVSLLSPSVRFRRIYSEKNSSDTSVLAALKSICAESEATGYGYELMLKAKITYVIAKLFENGDYRIDDRYENNGNVFADVLECVNKSYADSELTLDKVAKMSNFSRSYISRLFRENTGSSFCEYITAFRLEKACIMLKKANVTVLETALACGFSSVSYFIQVFKRAMGVTPLKYRNIN